MSSYELNPPKQKGVNFGRAWRMSVQLIASVRLEWVHELLIASVRLEWVDALLIASVRLEWEAHRSIWQAHMSAAYFPFL